MSFVVDASLAKFNTNSPLELLFGPPRGRQVRRQWVLRVLFIHIFFLQIFRLQCKKPYESLFRMDFPWGSMTTHKDDKFDDNTVNIGSFCLFFFFSNFWTIFMPFKRLLEAIWGASRRPIGGLWSRSGELSRYLGSVIEAHIALSGSKENEILGGFRWLLWPGDNLYVTCSIRLLEVILAYLAAMEIGICL